MGRNTPAVGAPVGGMGHLQGRYLKLLQLRHLGQVPHALEERLAQRLPRICHRDCLPQAGKARRQYLGRTLGMLQKALRLIGGGPPHGLLPLERGLGLP